MNMPWLLLTVLTALEEGEDMLPSIGLERRLAMKYCRSQPEQFSASVIWRVSLGCLHYLPIAANYYFFGVICVYGVTSE